MWFWSGDQLERLGAFLAEHGLCGPTVTADAIGDGHSNLTFLGVGRPFASSGAPTTAAAAASGCP